MLQGLGEMIRMVSRARSAVTAAMVLCWLATAGGAMASEPESDAGLVIIGASYAGGWPVASIGGLPVVNRGVGGQESHEMLARFAADVVAAHPRYVLIWGFINDVFRADPEQVEARLERSRAAYREMVEMARDAGIQPVLATEITMARSPGLKNAFRYWFDGLRGRRSYGERINGHVMAMNDWIREFGAANGLPVLDFEAVFADSSGWRYPAFATEDGSHVTATGYDALTAYVDEAWNQPVAR